MVQNWLTQLPADNANVVAETITEFFFQETLRTRSADRSLFQSNYLKLACFCSYVSYLYQGPSTAFQKASANIPRYLPEEHVAGALQQLRELNDAIEKAAYASA